MTLTPDQIVRIRRSWARVTPVSEMAGQLFYGRLFQLAPETRGLFRTDIAAQSAKLTATLDFTVDHLDQTDTLLEAVEDLGRRHAEFGVSPAHYEPVGEALLWMLEEILGPKLDAASREAWVAAYAMLAQVMQGATAEQ